MKNINILLIFILNFKLIFCQIYYLIQNENYPGLVLDIKDGSKEEGASVIIWTENRNANQLWSYENGFLTSKGSGKVLAVKSNQMMDQFEQDLNLFKQKKGPDLKTLINNGLLTDVVMLS